MSNLWREKCERIDSVLFVRFFPLLFVFNITANIIRDQFKSTGWVVLLEEFLDVTCLYCPCGSDGTGSVRTPENNGQVSSWEMGCLMSPKPVVAAPLPVRMAVIRHLRDVQIYFSEKELLASVATAFFRHYARAQWINNAGKPIKWK